MCGKYIPLNVPVTTRIIFLLVRLAQHVGSQGFVHVETFLNAFIGETFQYFYDPELILIGGGISAREDLIIHINRKLDGILSAIDLAKIKPTIGPCKFRQDANLLGAVYGFMKEG
ncbi:hypothetical protein [Gracilibacillus sp. Marseille-QA3620]